MKRDRKAGRKSKLDAFWIPGFLLVVVSDDVNEDFLEMDMNKLILIFYSTAQT